MRKTSAYGMKSGSKEYYQKYYIENKDRIQKRKTLHWRKQKEIRDKMNLKIKTEVFSYYSKGTPICNCCGINEIVFLTIDHINGGGRKHIKSIVEIRGGTNFYRWLRKNNYPDGFQVLCYNCNCGKRTFEECPHKLLNNQS